MHSLAPAKNTSHTCTRDGMRSVRCWHQLMQFMSPTQGSLHVTHRVWWCNLQCHMSLMTSHVTHRHGVGNSPLQRRGSYSCRVHPDNSRHLHKWHSHSLCLWEWGACTRKVHWWTHAGEMRLTKCVNIMLQLAHTHTHLSHTVTTMQHAVFTNKRRCQPTHLEAVVCSHPQWMEAYTNTHLYHSCSHSSRCWSMSRWKSSLLHWVRTEDKRGLYHHIMKVKQRYLTKCISLDLQMSQLGPTRPP